MSEADLIFLMKEALWVVFKISAPILISSMLVGLVISIFQTVTNIQEQTLTFVPKLLVMFLLLLLLGNWLLKEMINFTTELFRKSA